jgi:ribonuclease HI
VILIKRTKKKKKKKKQMRKETNEKVMDNVGSKRKHLMSNSTQMTYNVVEDLSKLRITFPFTEVVKIPQQRENILKLLDDPSEREEVVVTSPKQSQSQSTAKLRGKIPPFYISIENHDVALHNCLVDTGATNNIMPLAVMEALGMSCTKYYETGESIYAIDSRKVPAYGEIKDFYAWITTTPHIITVFNIIVVDLPPTYGVVLGRDWTSMIGGYIMNDGSCMMLPGKEGAMIKVPREPRKPFSFKKKDNELMEDYIDVGIGNYVILDMEHNEILEQVQDMENQECLFEGYWRMSFDGACSNSGNGVGIVLMSPNKVVHPHAIRLEFSCTNNEAEYEALIQGMILAQEMKIEHLIVTGDSELVINQVTQRYKIKKERLKLYFKRVNELMESFSSFNISFIPRDKNHKEDSLALAASLSNPDDIQRKMSFQVERAF